MLSDDSIADPELYDPATGTFTATGDYADKTIVRNWAGWAPATLLPNGKVLIAAEPTAELYDPATGTFSLTGQMTTLALPPTYISGRTATLLTNGKVLLAGGENEDLGRRQRRTIRSLDREVYCYRQHDSTPGSSHGDPTPRRNSLNRRWPCRHCRRALNFMTLPPPHSPLQKT